MRRVIRVRFDVSSRAASERCIRSSDRGRSFRTIFRTKHTICSRFIETRARRYRLPLSSDFLNLLLSCQTRITSNSLALDPVFFDLLADSRLRLTGASRLDSEVPYADGPRWLYEDAPFCVLAHDTDEDPR
ncbi:MEKHLA domain-containing protein [Burkholderia sp. ABCPW 14]|uniref:MEKHLA domain-containing protein n=1 Tax=Burkholderia sp. ABCPW 14 TaxID=1637860 RepID=UPI001E63227F|nr:MEKHLA domain-containing protein [Burkholderia sp. ABCPW 14]